MTKQIDSSKKNSIVSKYRGYPKNCGNPTRLSIGGGGNSFLRYLKEANNIPVTIIMDPKMYKICFTERNLFSILK